MRTKSYLATRRCRVLEDSYLASKSKEQAEKTHTVSDD